MLMHLDLDPVSGRFVKQAHPPTPPLLHIEATKESSSTPDDDDGDDAEYDTEPKLKGTEVSLAASSLLMTTIMLINDDENSSLKLFDPRK